MNKQPAEQEPLRQDAEMERPPVPLNKLTPRTAEELLYELQVHQIELEMQNDELRRAQIAIEESRDRYIEFYDFAPVGYLTLNHVGMIDEINLTSTTLLGGERSKLKRRRFDSFVVTEDRNRWHLHFLNLLKHGGTQTCELELQRDDGSRFHARLAGLRLSDASHKNGVRLVLSDNTESKHVTEALQQKTTELNEAQRIAHIGSWYLDARTGETTGSEELYRMFGRKIIPPFAEQRGTMYPPDAWKQLNVSVQEAVRTGSGFNLELPALREDGSSLWINTRSEPVRNAMGHVVGIRGTLQDITERKSLDQALQKKNIELQRSKSFAEKANLAKSSFLSSMSHELRTPLNAILGFAQLLEIGSPPPTPVQVGKIKQITKAGWYLLELINEILDLSVIESGKLSLFLESVSLIDVIVECQAMFELQGQPRDIKLTFFSFDHTWFAHADRTRVKQVLINLLSNAIKYNREHGTVEVRCTAHTPERIRISIKDSGEGLPAEKLAQLFQPFNRLGQETGTEEGTGIGLVVTKQLVELMGGTIGVESTVGVGSEFWIELIRDVAPQLAAGNTMPVELTPKTQGDAALRTLLYVEDNPANLMLVEQIIEGYPHIRMLSARDGNHGIALARVHVPDVILMDINLPGISGFQVLSILREDPVTAHIPVLAISANAIPRDIMKGLEAGFFRYLTKPIKVNEFMAALDLAMEFAKNGAPSRRLQQ